MKVLEELDIAHRVRPTVVSLLSGYSQTSYLEPGSEPAHRDPTIDLSMTVDAARELRAWLSNVEDVFGPFAHTHPARVLRALLDQNLYP